MATIVRTPSETWKAVIRKRGWPTTAKTFRTQRDAKDWARRTEDEMVRGVYIERGASERLTLGVALDRYLSEVTPTKKPTTQQTEIERAKPLRAFFSKYSLAAITPDLVARYRDMRLATALKPQKGSKATRLTSASTVRLELALLGHLFTTAIREWRLGLAQNPVALVRKPKPAEGRDRRLDAMEEQALMRAVDAHSNPMLGWIVRIAVETGMRSGEILGLRLSQIDIRRRIVRLSDTKNDSARTVPLSRLGRLRQVLVDVSKAANEGNEDLQRLLTARCYGQLRLAWERCIEEVLLNGAVQRFSEGVSTQRLKGVTVTDDDYREIDAGMTKCSKFEHDAAAVVGRLPIPAPEELSDDIEKLAKWRQTLNKRVEGIAKGVATRSALFAA